MIDKVFCAVNKHVQRRRFLIYLVADFILDNAFKLRFKTGYVNKHDYSFSHDGIDSF